MQRWIICTAITGVVLLLAACTGGDETSALTLPEWAAEVCATAQSVADASASDGVDPTALTIEERKERSAGLMPQVAATFRTAAEELKGIEPPSGTSQYHQALQRQLEEMADTIEESAVKIQAAESAEQIEAANAELNIVMERTGQTVAEAAESLPDEAKSALRGVNKCGNVVA